MNDDSTSGSGGNPARQIPAADAAPARVCPHCASARVQGWGAARGLPRYRCGNCKRTFNPLTGTSLARLRSKDKWFLFMRTVTQQKSVRKSAEICGVDNSTVMRWRVRFKACTPAERRSIMLALTDSCTASFQNLQESAIGATPDWASELLLTILCWLN